VFLQHMQDNLEMNSEESIKILECVMELSKHMDSMSKLSTESEFLAFDRFKRIFLTLSELVQLDKLGRRPEELNIYEFQNGCFQKVV
jgi:hypothetical protein